MGLNKKQKIIVAIFLFLIVVIFLGVYIKPYYAFEQKITYILDEKNKKFSSADVLSDYEMEQLQKISLYKCIAKNKQLFFTREQIQEILLILYFLYTFVKTKFQDYGYNGIKGGIVSKH